MSTHHNLVLQISGGMDRLQETLQFLNIDKRIRAWRIDGHDRLILSAQRETVKEHIFLEQQEKEEWYPFPARLSTDALCGVVREFLMNRTDAYVPGGAGFLLRVTPRCFCSDATEVCGAPDPCFYHGFRMSISPYPTSAPQVFKISGEFNVDEIYRNVKFMQDFFHIRFDGESYPLADGGYLLGINSVHAVDESFTRVPAIAILINSKIRPQVRIPNVICDEGSPGYLLEYVPSKTGFGSLLVRPYVCFWHK